MAIFHGKGGGFTWSGTGAEENKLTVLNWQVTVTADIAEATDMGDTWKTFKAGFKDWTATTECLADTTTDILAIGEGGTLKLEMVDTSSGLSGAAICTGVSVAVDKDDIGKITYTWQGNGALAYAA